MTRRFSAAEESADEPMTQEKWQAQDPCPSCGARPGYNPATGVWVRSWDAAKRTFIEGHRDNCVALREGKV